MAKTKISEFSSTPANNTDIDSINIAEGCAPSGINDAIRELMSQLKDWQSGASNDPYVVGSSGSLTLNQGTANTVPYLNGSKVVTSGTALSFDGANLGLGVTPSAWGASWKSMSINTVGALASTTGVTRLYHNAYNNDSNNIYRTTAAASMYSQDGAHSWFVAPSGTAGNAISFTQAMTLDSDGDLGIGVTSPAYKLDVKGGTGNSGFARISSVDSANGGAGLILQGATSGQKNWVIAGQYNVNGGLEFTQTTSNGGSTISSTPAMTLNASGNLGIGTTSPSDTSSYGRALDIQSSTGAAIYLRDSDVPTTNYGVVAYDSSIDSLTLGSITASTGIMRFIAAGSERARIDSSGNLLVGATSAGTVGAFICPATYSYTTGSGANVFVDSSGRIMRSTSSLKYKTDVTDATHGLADVLKLRSVTYKTNGESDGDAIFGGLIAEEVHAAGLTEFVQYADDGTPDAISYGSMVSLAFKAIQEQQAIIESLKARLDAANL